MGSAVLLAITHHYDIAMMIVALLFSLLVATVVTMLVVIVLNPAVLSAVLAEGSGMTPE